MERVTIKIETGNAAFEDSPASEIARILRKLGADFEANGLPSSVLFDANGNRCGTVEIVESDD